MAKSQLNQLNPVGEKNITDLEREVVELSKGLGDLSIGSKKTNELRAQVLQAQPELIAKMQAQSVILQQIINYEQSIKDYFDQGDGQDLETEALQVADYRILSPEPPLREVDDHSFKEEHVYPALAARRASDSGVSYSYVSGLPASASPVMENDEPESPQDEVQPPSPLERDAGYNQVHGEHEATPEREEGGADNWSCNEEAGIEARRPSFYSAPANRKAYQNSPHPNAISPDLYEEGVLGFLLSIDSQEEPSSPFSPDAPDSSDSDSDDEGQDILECSGSVVEGAEEVFVI